MYLMRFLISLGTNLMKSDRVVELGRLRWTTSVLIRVPSCIFNWKFHWAIKDNFLLLILKFENFKDIFISRVIFKHWIALQAMHEYVSMQTLHDKTPQIQQEKVIC